MKRIHVKFNPETELWEVLELEDWESYYDDVRKYGEEVAKYNYEVVINGAPQPKTEEE